MKIFAGPRCGPTTQNVRVHHFALGFLNDQSKYSALPLSKKKAKIGDLATANENFRTVPPPKKGQNFGDLVTANENNRPVLGAMLVLCCPPVVARRCQVDAHSPTCCRCQLHLKLPHRRPSCSSRPRPRGHRTTTSYVLVVPAR